MGVKCSEIKIPKYSSVEHVRLLVEHASVHGKSAYFDLVKL